MAENPLAPHDCRIAVDGRDRARGGVHAPARSRRFITRWRSWIISRSWRVTPDGRIPIVRQYRPAIEAFTWELPAGLVERGEEPAVGRLPRTAGGNRLSDARHSFARGARRRLHRPIEQPHPFVFCRDRRTRRRFHAEPGLTVALKSPGRTCELIKSGGFVQQLHLGALLLAELARRSLRCRNRRRAARRSHAGGARRSHPAAAPARPRRVDAGRHRRSLGNRRSSQGRPSSRIQTEQISSVSSQARIG